MLYLNDYPIQTIDIENEDYSKPLKKIADAPRKLFFRGVLPTNEKCFAIVGTRRASDYGKDIAFSFAKRLAETGLAIVSGMALGIDTLSHKGALEAKGKTIAVLATGLDEKCLYPQENLKLARQILEKGGCLISEYPEGTAGFKQNFLQRNRIIAGLGLGVLVVEAKIKSGALSTASWAKKYQRKVFAVPGNIHLLNSQGCHYLIKRGAILADSPNDILKNLNITQTAKRNIVLPANETEAAILHVLRAGPSDIDKIIELTKMPPQKISVALSIMEFENKIKNLGGNVYALTG